MKLNVLLAKLEHGSERFKAIIREYHKYFKTSGDQFRGVKNTYAPRPDTKDEPSMRTFTAVVTTVDEKFDYLVDNSVEYIQDMFNCEATNASGSARADLVVNGKVIANLSSLELLKLKSFLENQQLLEMMSVIPVRSDAEIWKATTEDAYMGRAIVESELLTGVKKTVTKEQYILKDPNISAGVTANYVPQVAVKDTVVEIGDYTMQRFSGEWTSRQRAEVLKRRSDLLSAVVVALKQANESETMKSNLDAQWLMSYLVGKN